MTSTGLLPEPVLGWLAELTGGTVTSARPLPGGTHADTYLLRTRTGETVLRRFPPDDSGAVREARVLTALDGLDGLCPRLLASDVDGATTGRPTTLISRLRGTAEITASEPDGWAEELGKALALVHATPLDRIGDLPALADTRGGQLGLVSGPLAALVESGWEALHTGPDVLTHYDFWSGNVLWDAGSVSGVVDWSGAAIGPAAFDLGWCRLDLVLLHGERVADVLTQAYASTLGSPVDPRLGDLWAAARSHTAVGEWAPNYADLGRADLDAATLRRLHREWSARLLSRG